MLGGEIPLIALFRETGQLVMRSAIVRAGRNGRGPPLDAGRERLVDVAGGLFRPAVAALADAVEEAPRLRLCLGLIGKEGVFERDLVIGGVEPHGLPKLGARQFVFTDFEVGIGKIFAEARDRKSTRLKY